ncbi:RICIN domain-containing protein [Micromonospora chersina]|uniref:RICIN domain-containing protein n=1 Tax=Micromonospora chersina TaxID=47854 RepID=UPI0037131251
MESYYIKALHSAKALTVSSLNEGAAVRQHTVAGSTADSIAKLQLWRTVTFGNGVESYMLAKKIKASDGSLVYGCIQRPGIYSGQTLVIKRCDGGHFQQWLYQMVGPGVHYQIQGVASSFYWKIQNASLADGANLTQSPTVGGWETRFRWVYSGSSCVFC